MKRLDEVVATERPQRPNGDVDLAIVGAGAAGLAAAIFAAEHAQRSKPLNIALLDGANTIGAKILVSGGGRCNVTHHQVAPADFFGNRNIIKNILAAFSVEDTTRWLASLGVELKQEQTGKLFPITDRARTVLNALIDRCREQGVKILAGKRVTEVERCEGGFIVYHTQGLVRAKKIILATGGRSLPKSGSDGHGYELARRLGHHVTRTSRALVPLVLDKQCFHQDLAGLSQVVELTTWVGRKMADRRKGSLLWTHFGISGPIVMDASRFWTLARHEGAGPSLFGNFFPGFTQEQMSTWVMEQADRMPRRTLTTTLAQRVPERFAQVFCHYIHTDPAVAIAQCPKRERDRLLGSLTRFVFPIEWDRGWNHAEVTAGGVPLEEINYRTMESKLVPDLYLVGEILDCDGRIGGFNFQWAWATGFLAGRAAASP